MLNYSGSKPRSDPAPEKTARRAQVEPLSPARYHVHFTASAAFGEKLDRLAALMPGVDLASMLEAAVSEKLERMEAKRLGKTQRPRKKMDQDDTSPGVRGIPAPVRRLVWTRDSGQCTYVSAFGRRCPERHGLEFHHGEPHGLGGDRSANNIRLMCRAHNHYMAERDYGKDFMERFRGSADRAREPAPSLPLRVRTHLISLHLSAFRGAQASHCNNGASASSNPGDARGHGARSGRVFPAYCRSVGRSSI